MARPAPPSACVVPIDPPPDSNPSEFPDLLGTDALVEILRRKIPGGLSKRSVYQWCDMGCPHIVIPGGRGKLAFILAEVLAWFFSHRVQRQLLPERMATDIAIRRRRISA